MRIQLNLRISAQGRRVWGLVTMVNGALRVRSGFSQSVENCTSIPEGETVLYTLADGGVKPMRPYRAWLANGESCAQSAHPTLASDARIALHRQNAFIAACQMAKARRTGPCYLISMPHP